MDTSEKQHMMTGMPNASGQYGPFQTEPPCFLQRHTQTSNIHFKKAFSDIKTAVSDFKQPDSHASVIFDGLE